MGILEERATAFADKIHDEGPNGKGREVWHFMDEVYTELKEAYIEGATKGFKGFWKDASDEDKRKFMACIYNAFDGAEAAELIDLGILLIINAWKLQGKNPEIIDRVSEYAAGVLKEEMQAILNTEEEQ